jgi:hypothetical protein
MTAKEAESVKPGDQIIPKSGLCKGRVGMVTQVTDSDKKKRITYDCAGAICTTTHERVILHYRA